jgi:hypothetical protein
LKVSVSVNAFHEKAGRSQVDWFLFFIRRAFILPSGPNLDLIAIRVADVGVRAARTEFAPPPQLTTGALDFLDSCIDVPR